MRFSLVTLFVEDHRAQRDFYTSKLGLTVVDETDRFVRLADADGNPCVAFHTGQPVGNADHVQLHFEVDDVDAAYEEVRGRGVTFTEAPADQPWGWRVASLADPAGYTVELVRKL